MTAKALQYAENTLGVHACYERSEKARKDLDECLTKLSSIRDQKRILDQAIQDREMELAEEERGKHPDMSQAAMDKHLKIAWNKDPNLRQLNADVREAASQAEGLEYDKDIFEAGIRIETVRMFELGGYLNYLAAVKLEKLGLSGGGGSDVIGSQTTSPS